MQRALALLTLILFSTPALASGQSVDNTTLLLQRIASQGGGTAQVLVGKLPADIPKIPLPSASLLGSVHRTIDAPISSDTYDLYYSAEPGTFKSYGDTLLAAGWKLQHSPLLNDGGGFVSSGGPTGAAYCKSDAPIVSVAGGADPNDLRVSISASGDRSDLLCGGNPFQTVMRIMQSNLPQLRAPAGVTMTASQIGFPGNQSAAYIRNGTSPAALLAVFATQMAHAGWQAGETSTGKAIATETFRRTDDKKTTWQSVITIYAVDGKPGEFAAFVQAANLKTLAL